MKEKCSKLLEFMDLLEAFDGQLDLLFVDFVSHLFEKEEGLITGV